MNMLKPILIAVVFATAGPLLGFATAATTAIKNESPVKYGKITKQEVFWMYTMKTRFWNDGTKVTVVYQDFSSRAHIDFCVNVLDTTTDRFERVVNTYINQGNAAYFIKANTENEVANKVGKTDGAIGYLSSEFVLVNRGGQIEKLRIVD